MSQLENKTPNSKLQIPKKHQIAMVLEFEFSLEPGTRQQEAA
jgi:hypothetical protein